MGDTPLYPVLPSIHVEADIPGGLVIGIGVLAERTALYNAVIIEDHEGFVVERFEVAGEPQTDSAFPASAFAPDPQPARLRLGTRRGPGIHAGMSVDFTVRNLTPATRRFRASVVVL